MSLLIDALKRAERAKSGQAEPQLSTPNSIERAVRNEANPIDWQLADALPEPKVRNTPSDLADTATSRPEPQLGDGMLRSEIPRGKPAAAKVGDSAIAPSQPKSASTNKSTGTTTTAAEREAAKTLFAAKRPAPRNRAGILAAGGLAALLLAGGGFYVWYSLAFPPGPAIQPLQARAPLPAAQSSVVAPIAATAPTASAPLVSALPAAAQPPSLAATGVTEPTATPSTKSKPAHNGTRRSAMRTDNLSTEETVRREVEQAQRRKSTTSRRTSTVMAYASIVANDAARRSIQTWRKPMRRCCPAIAVRRNDFTTSHWIAIRSASTRCLGWPRLRAIRAIWTALSNFINARLNSIHKTLRRWRVCLP